ncbi:MAG: single-stranded-DNA-specific exonuclease RecJ, partial [Planctomycetota bacterium]
MFFLFSDGRINVKNVYYIIILTEPWVRIMKISQNKKYQWLLPTPEEVKGGIRLASQLGLQPLTGKILYRRGLQTPSQARSFLYPSLDELEDPFLFAHMEKAVERIGLAIKKRERIWIYGDYDVDGVTSTAVISKILRFLGANVERYIPHRLKEGYGLHKDWILEAQKKGIGLLICVDNGTSAFQEVEYADSLNIPVIIVDHHFPKDKGLPPAYAILNPKMEDASYPFPHLAGVGVALKLAFALAEKYCTLSQKRSSEFEALVQELLAFAALGTIADLVPLIQENRVIAKYGLLALERSKSPGIHALLDVAGVRDRSLHVRDISFKLAPLINAAGRMGEALEALYLLEADSTVEAYKLGKNLARHNRKRREICREIYQDALRRIKEEEQEESPLLVLASQDWHPGLVGIVAARLATEFKRPVVLLAQDGDFAKGSARSVMGKPIYPLLEKLESHFLRFGGHMLAAGFEMEKTQIPCFIENLLGEGKEYFEKKVSRQGIPVDGEAKFLEITPALVRELDLFSPYGQTNTKPLLFSRNLSIVGRPRRYGHQNKHLLLYLRQGDKVLK